MNPETELGVLLSPEEGVKAAWPEWAELKRARPRVVLKTETLRPKGLRETSLF